MVRIVYLDIIRVIAIVFVIMCHLPFLWDVDMVSEKLPLFWVVNQSLGILGVPLFMMISGALLLNKNFHSVYDIKMFYKKNMLPILGVGVVWNLIYYFLNGHCFSFRDIVKTLCLINKPVPHMWYIRVIVLYYMFIPLFVCLLKKYRICLICLLCLISGITFLYNGYLILVQHESFPTNSVLSISCYLVYMVFGYYIVGVEKKIPQQVFFLAFSLSVVLLVLLRLYNYFAFYWYDNPLVLIASVSLFKYIKIICGEISVKSWIVDMSKITFGVYLSHMLIIIYVIKPIVGFFLINNIFAYPLILFFVLLCSICLIKIIHKVPIASSVLFRY